MEKKETELVSEFKDMEKKIQELLKNNKLQIDDETSPSVIKKRIKEYIALLSEIQNVFVRYEKIAEEIQAISGLTKDKSYSGDKEKLSEQISKKVVGLRKEPKTSEEKPSQLGAANANNSYEDKVAKMIKSKAENLEMEQEQMALKKNFDDDEYETKTTVIDGKVYIKKQKKSKDMRNL